MQARFLQADHFWLANPGHKQLVNTPAVHVGDLEAPTIPIEVVAGSRDSSKLEQGKTRQRVEVAAFRTCPDLKLIEGIVRQHPAIHPQRTVVLLDDLRLHGDAYYLADPPAAERTYGFEEALTFFRRMAAGELPSTVFEGGNGPATTQFICGFLGCDLRPFNPVLSALPRLLRVRPATQTGDGLPNLIAFAMDELRERRSGGQVVRLRMAELLFVDVIRRHLETLPGEKVGWLAGLRNPLVARVLSLLHDAPAQSWTLDALAAQAGTSRSVLAERFVHFIGQPPMQYLRQLRMQLASRLLVEDGAKVVSVAAAVGFESEAAFSRAFKRCVERQSPPRQSKSRVATRVVRPLYSVRYVQDVRRSARGPAWGSLAISFYRRPSGSRELVFRPSCCTDPKRQRLSRRSAAAHARVDSSL